jgi:four helix bundle protein
MRSGIAVGALVRESEYGQSKPDFISKLSIALKEANETEYWLSLLKEGGFLIEQDHVKLTGQCIEFIKLLTASINTAKRNI